MEHQHTYRRSTVVLLLDVRAAFDSLDKNALWDSLLKYSVLEKYVAIIKFLCRHTSGRWMACDKLLFVVSSDVWQGCLIQPFLFNFAIDDVLNRLSQGLLGDNVELLPGHRLPELEYADDLVLLVSNIRAVQFLDRLTAEAVG